MKRYVYSAAGQVVRRTLDCPALDQNDHARRMVSLAGVCAVAVFTLGASATGAMVWEQLQAGQAPIAEADALLAGNCYSELDVHRAMQAVRKNYAQIITIAWQLELQSKAS
ncbi:hypothetical protein ACSV9I_16725 [Rhizobium sp. G187]|uniref:hypothetical protein n=1 Tax=Rhizobium sp. G187 TaxID=3451352 RepID=UPI003EE62CFF